MPFDFIDYSQFGDTFDPTQFDDFSGYTGGDYYGSYDPTQYDDYSGYTGGDYGTGLPEPDPGTGLDDGFGPVKPDGGMMGPPKDLMGTPGGGMMGPPKDLMGTPGGGLMGPPRDLMGTDGTKKTSSLFDPITKMFGGGNTTPGGSSSTDWLLPLLGGAAAGYLLPKIASGFGGGNAPTVQAPNYLDQFERIKAPSYAPLPAIQIGQNPGMNMQMPQAFPVAPRG